MTEYRFHRAGYVFDEIVSFSIPLVGMTALARFPELKRQIDDLVSLANVAKSDIWTPGQTIPNIVIPDNTTVLGKVVDCTLIETQAFAADIQAGKPIMSLVYVDENLLATGTKVLRQYPTPDSILPAVARTTLGSAYETVKGALASSLGGSQRNWPPLLQYFRHCRNAAFHGNRFNVRPYRDTPAIDPAKPPTWRDSIMPDDATMNTYDLIGGFIEAGDVPILLADVSAELLSRGIAP